jgi:hypothetical protein
VLYLSISYSMIGYYHLYPLYPLVYPRCGIVLVCHRDAWAILE